VSTTFQRASLGAGLAVFLAYAAGMGVVLTGLAVAVALARQTLVRRLRGVLRHVERASGLLLAAAGAYVAWYGWVELRLAAGSGAPAGPVAAATRISGRISTWISDVGAPRIGLAMCGLGLAAFVVERRRRRPLPARRPEQERVRSCR
jgi:ABC-type nickel/cobalt efflux system permease component RcnA